MGLNVVQKLIHSYLKIGAGGIDVVMAIAGRPSFFKMPEIWGVELVGELSDWVSAKDVILEILRRCDVKGIDVLLSGGLTNWIRELRSK